MKNDPSSALRGIVTKEALETLIRHLELGALIFGALVAIGVAGETFFGVRIWWNNRKLQRILNSENLTLQTTIGTLQTEVANARTRQADAETEVLRLRKESEPRRLTGPQKGKLVNLLQTEPSLYPQ